MPRAIRPAIELARHARRVQLADAARLLSQPGRPATPHLSAKADGTRHTDMKQELYAAGRQATITGVRWHGPRHSFAPWLVQSGADLYHLPRILGHSTVQMSLDRATFAPGTSTPSFAA